MVLKYCILSYAGFRELNKTRINRLVCRFTRNCIERISRSGHQIDFGIFQVGKRSLNRAGERLPNRERGASEFALRPHDVRVDVGAAAPRSHTRAEDPGSLPVASRTRTFLAGDNALSVDGAPGVPKEDGVSPTEPPNRLLATMRAAVDSYPTAMGRIGRYITDNPEQVLRFSDLRPRQRSAAGAWVRPHAVSF